MTIQIERYTAPAHWACYFINDDPSGMDDADIAAADQWIKIIGLGAPVDCSSDAEFMRWHDAHHVMPLAADCCTYTFLRT